MNKNSSPRGDLYRLIVRSRLPAAERFERWLFDEVLPSIRKQGAYIPAGQLPDIIANAVQATVIEMTKQLLPALVEAVASSRPDKCTGCDEPSDDTEIMTTIITEKKRRRRNVPGKIEQLPQSLQNELVAMLKNEATYAKVSDFLLRRGYQISKMAVCRFYDKTLA